MREVGRGGLDAAEEWTARREGHDGAEAEHGMRRQETLPRTRHGALGNQHDRLNLHLDPQRVPRTGGQESVVYPYLRIYSAPIWQG